MSIGHPVRLVLPHQLFGQHFDAAGDTVFVLIEHDLLFRHYAFHSHKLVLHRASMDRFADRLRADGREVEVLRSNANSTSRSQLADVVRRLQPARVTWFDVVDDWVERDLFQGLADGGYQMPVDDILETPNFLTDRAQIDGWFAHNGSRMQDFYAWQRRRLNILLDDDGKPVGGKWSFDADNRKKLPRGYTPPRVRRFGHSGTEGGQGTFTFDTEIPGKVDDGDAVDTAVQDAIAWVSAEFPDAPGDPRLFGWPTSAEEAREHLEEFVRERLNDFGPYEDAISTQHPFIAHSLLTPVLNIGLLDPRDVLDAVLDAVDQTTPLASLEGFVRQVIGWREYMRATYRAHGPQMRSSNRLDHHNTLGPGWWTAATGLAPVDMVISRVIATGYAHHIERLMVLGNAMSLLRVHPDSVYEWFMELFIDAYDWVMVPNVYAMSQFAAGPQITTKPYVSGSNYLRKMSDLPAGDWTATWDGLYWTFVADHRNVFQANPRTRMVASLVENMDPAVRADHFAAAKALLDPGTGDTPLLRHRTQAKKATDP